MANLTKNQLPTYFTMK